MNWLRLASSSSVPDLSCSVTPASVSFLTGSGFPVARGALADRRRDRVRPPAERTATELNKGMLVAEAIGRQRQRRVHGGPVHCPDKLLCRRVDLTYRRRDRLLVVDDAFTTTPPGPYGLPPQPVDSSCRHPPSPPLARGYQTPLHLSASAIPTDNSASISLNKRSHRRSQSPLTGSPGTPCGQSLQAAPHRVGRPMSASHDPPGVNAQSNNTN